MQQQQYQQMQQPGMQQQPMQQMPPQDQSGMQQGVMMQQQNGMQMQYANDVSSFLQLCVSLPSLPSIFSCSEDLLAVLAPASTRARFEALSYEIAC